MKTLLRSRFLSTSAIVLAVLAPLGIRGAEFGNRIGNLSTRAQVGTGANIMVSGFVVSEGAPKKILIRAVGPALAVFAVTGTLGAPVLSLYDAKGALLSTNNGWSISDVSMISSVGAFALTPGSRDAAIVSTLSPGAYTAQVSGAGGTSGVALLEIYDVTGPAHLINFSTRALVGAGSDTLVAGLVIAPGSGLRHLLVRAAGPALASFNVPGANTDPALAVLDGQGRQLAANDNWDTANIREQLANAFTQAGAFHFPSASKDAALVVDLPPGSFSILVSGVGGATGLALVEVYDLTLFPGGNEGAMTAFEPPQAASVQPGGSSGCVAAQDDLLPYLFSGEFHLAATDLVINGVGLDFVWARKYRSTVGRNTAQGNGWDFSYNIQVAPSGPDYIVYDGNGRMDTYRVQADGTYGADQLFCEGTLSKAVFTLKFPDNGTWEFLPFNGSTNQGKIGRITDRNGNTLVFDYSADGLLTNIVDTLGRKIQVGYNAAGFVSAITDFANRRVTYTYYQNDDAGGSFGDLKSVTSPTITGTLNGNDFPDGKTVTYTYSKGFAGDFRNHKLLTITDAKGQTWLRNTYAATTNRADFNYGRLMSQMRGYSNEVLTFFYNPQPPLAANQFAVTSAIVNDRVGNVSEYLFDPMNNLVRLRQFTGRAVPGVTTTETQNRPTGKLRASDPDFFETRHEWNVDSRPTRTVFPNGNSVENTYELVLTPNVSRRFRGNLRARTSLPGPLGGDQAAINETFVYDITFGGCCGFNFVTQATDGRGNTTYHSYDGRGNRISTSHNIPSVVESFEYNAFGQMTAHVLPDNGSSHRRRDQMDYYQDGPQRGYLQRQIQDVGGLSLTTTIEYDSVGNPVRQIDPRSKDTLYAVNTLNQVVRETSREVIDGSGIGYLRDMFYDANNNLRRVDVQNLNEAGIAPTNNPTFTTTYEYDILNMRLSEKHSLDLGGGVATEYAYDPNRNLTLIRYGVRYGEAFAGRDTNNVVQTVFDERHLPLDVTRGQGAGQSTTRNDYDGNRNLMRVSHGTESDPRVTTHSYDGYNRRTATVDAMGNVQTSRFDANGNLMFERTDGELNDSPGGASNVRLAEISYSYDAMNRKTHTVAAYFDSATGQPIGGGQSVSQTIYSGTSQVTQQIDAYGHGTTNDYDTANRLRTVTDAKGNTTTYTYDDRSRVTQISQVDKSDLGSPNQTFITTNSYDNLDRLIQSVDNIGNTNRWGYDSRNNRTLAIDGRGNVTRFAFDGLNRLIQTTRDLTDTGEGSGKIIKSIVTSQAWDDSSRLISQTDDNGNTNRYVYDALNRLVRTVFADGTANSVIYDVHDNAVSMTDANGSVATINYDLLNRVTSKLVSRAVGVLGTRFEYYRYDGLSRVVLAGSDDSEVTRGYDSLSHITIETQQVFPGGLVRTIARAYDNVGNQVSCTYPGGRVVACAYDALNRKQTITDALGDLARYSYFGPDRVQRSDHGNGTRADLGYDGVRRLTSTLHTRVAGGALIDSRSYGWDAANNKTAVTDLLPLAQDSRSYRYDSVHRLVHSATAVVGPVIDYAFDGVDNRLQVSGGSQAGAYVLNPAVPPADAPVNQYTTTPFDARTYDANGNLTEAGPQRFTYDYKNRLVAAFRLNGVSYTNTLTAKYDCFGRRIEKAVPGATARYYYAASQEIEEQNGANATVATYIWGRGIDELIETERNGQSYFYHGDDLGSVRKVTDATGNVVEQYNYGDYGEPRFFNATGAALSGTQIGNFTLFTGRRYDPETGLHYYRTRYLDPNAGRFTTRDTIGIWGDAVNLGNGTAYVGNNPGTRGDPSGAQPNWEDYCNQEQIYCYRNCWNSNPPWPIIRGDWGHRAYCTTKCRVEFMACLGEQVAQMAFATMAAAIEWLHEHPEMVVGTVVAVGVVLFIIATDGSGALILVPLGA